MDESTFLEQLPQLLGDWIPKTASIAIADRERYIVYRAGSHDLHIHPGDTIPPGSIVERVFHGQKRVESDVDSSVFGTPYHGLGYPLRTETGEESALAVILPPRYHTPQLQLSYLMGKSDQIWRPVAVEDVVYLESYQKKTWIHTTNAAFTTDYTLQSLETRLPSDKFLRIHRSFLVNVAFIDYIERDDRANLIITLATPAHIRLSVGQSYVRYVRSTLGF